MARLNVTEVHKRLGGNHILRGTSFTLGQGEIVALLGPSGSGKTTLLRAVAGLDHPDAGRIVLDDEVLYDGEAGLVVPAEKRSLGLVFQSYALWPHKTVFENVAYGLKLRKVPAKEIAERVAAVLGQIGLTGMADRHPHQLSGGQQQRVALSRAIVYNPRLILLDEPLSNLDAKLREEARVWLRGLIQQLKISAIMVTHDQSEALAIADRILLLDQGRIEQEATPVEIYERPATLFAAEFMGTNNRFGGRVAEVKGDRCRVEGDGWQLWGRMQAERRVGDSVEVLVRLEKTLLKESAGENRLEAKLETALYLGDRWDCVFLASGLRLRLWAPSSPARGPYWIHVPEASLLVF
jgi:iron(III) transport system ATP-binding protein